MSIDPAAYPRDNAALPEINESDIETADVGLYRVRGRLQRGDWYRPETDSWERDVNQILLARVDDGPTQLPGGVFRAEIRADGKRLILDWVIA